MHRNPHKRDDAATRAAKFLSKYSYVSRRIHPGTEGTPQEHPCIYLAGADCGVMRDKVFLRDEHCCVICGKWVPKQGSIWTRGHVDHLGGNTKVSRCWCFEALALKCYEDHLIKKHGRELRFGEKVA